MQTLRRALTKFSRVIQNYSSHIWCFCMLIMGPISFFHFQWAQNNKDLLYWLEYVKCACNYLWTSILIIYIPVIIIAIPWLISGLLTTRSTDNRMDSISQTELKKRYEDDEIPLENFILAHEEMRHAIDRFRCDARKLITLSEVEVSLPSEEVYCITESDERDIQQSRFYNMGITLDNNVLKKLLNP